MAWRFRQHRLCFLIIMLWIKVQETIMVELEFLKKITEIEFLPSIFYESNF